jgi:hypothetical protein
MVVARMFMSANGIAVVIRWSMGVGTMAMKRAIVRVTAVRMLFRGPFGSIGRER